MRRWSTTLLERAGPKDRARHQAWRTQANLAVCLAIGIGTPNPCPTQRRPNNGGQGRDEFGGSAWSSDGTRSTFLPVDGVTHWLVDPSPGGFRTSCGHRKTLSMRDRETVRQSEKPERAMNIQALRVAWMSHGIPGTGW